MERAITEIMYMVSQGKDLEIALHTILSKYTMTRNDKALMVIEHSWEEDLMLYKKRKLMEGKSIGTIKNYVYLIECFFQTVNKPIKDVTPDDIQLYLMYKRNVENNTDKYVMDIRTKLNGFFGWAWKSNLIDSNPVLCVPQIKVQKKHVESYTNEEVERMRRVCERGRNPIRDRAIFELLYSSGMRCDELISLDINDIDINRKEGVIRHGKGNKKRKFLFSDVAAMYIREYLKTYDGLDGALFVSSRSKRRMKDDSSLETIVKKWGKDGGVLNAFPHRFRHTFITRCIDIGMNIEDVRFLVGHEDIKTTKGYYDDNFSRIKTEHTRLCA